MFLLIDLRYHLETQNEVHFWTREFVTKYDVCWEFLWKSDLKQKTFCFYKDQSVGDWHHPQNSNNDDNFILTIMLGFLLLLLNAGIYF